MTKTLVALHAHPDDESSKGAATVAKYVDHGVRAVLVTATGGEAGDILNPAMDSPDVRSNLREVRQRELEDAARIIGYHRLELLGYRDSGMPDTDDNRRAEAFVNCDFEEALERIVRILRDERPQVVLGYDDHARYPHPDHLLIHDLSLAAFDAAADPERFPDAGEPWEVDRLFAPVFTVARLQTLHDAMLARHLESPFLEWMERISDEDVARDEKRHLVRVEVAATLERGREALRAHRTQVDPDGFWFQVPLSIVTDVYPYEDFEVLAARSEVPEELHDLFA